MAACYKWPVLLPMVIEDALKVGFTRDAALIRRVIAQLLRQIVPLANKQWHTLIVGAPGLRVRLQPAVHIVVWRMSSSTYGPPPLPAPGPDASCSRVTWSW